MAWNGSACRTRMRNTSDTSEKYYNTGATALQQIALMYCYMEIHVDYHKSQSDTFRRIKQAISSVLFIAVLKVAASKSVQH